MSASRPAPVSRTSVLVGAIAVVTSIVLCAIIAAIARALGADPSFRPLTPIATSCLAAVGTVVGILGWVAIARRAARPARVLGVLVPVLLVLSLVPDALLLVSGAAPVAIGALMSMHLVVAAVAVLAGERIAPVTGARAVARARRA